MDVEVTGLIATLPDYAAIDVSEAAELIKLVYPQRVPNVVQSVLLLTEDDQAFVVIAAMDAIIDRFITAGTVIGKQLPTLIELPADLDFVGGVIVSDNVSLQAPIKTTPEQVIQDPTRFALQRVSMDTTYILSAVRLRGAPECCNQIGFGAATDRFGSESPDDYLTVVDPYNTETQIRTAELQGTVLYPTQGTRRMLAQVLRFAPEDVAEALDRPSVFYENLTDDEAQLVNIGDLVPTLEDPSRKLHRFHGELIAIEGIALGNMVRTEDIPLIRKSPVHLTFKMLGVIDLTGAMPIIGISAENVSGEVYGHFRFELSVYSFEDDKAFAFLIRKEAVPLDPISHITRAELGDRVQLSLTAYSVTRVEQLEIDTDLVLEQINLLVPKDPENPVILTRHSDLNPGDFLKSISLDGFLVDGRFLGIDPKFLSSNIPGVVVVDESAIQFEKGVLPAVLQTTATVVVAPPIPAPSPTATPVPPLLTPIPTSTQRPSPTIIPTPALVPTPLPMPTQVPLLPTPTPLIKL